MYDRFRRFADSPIRPFFILLLALGASPRTAVAGELVSRSWPVMGTYAEAQIWAERPEKAAEAIEAVRAVFDRVNRTMSVYDPASDISRVNALAGIAPARVDRWVTDLVKKSKHAYEVTAGAFSINILNPAVALGLKPAPLRPFAPSPPPLLPPSDDRIQVNGLYGTLYLPHDVALDLGGIAKGYALDRAAQSLRARGYSRFFLSLGREILAGDPPPGEAGWPVRLEHEREPRLIANQAISVSRQGLTSDTGHILDPKSGKPVSANRVVAVAARRGWVADMASTALMVDPSLGDRLRAAYPDILWMRVDWASGQGAHMGAPLLDAQPAERGE